MLLNCKHMLLLSDFVFVEVWATVKVIRVSRKK